MKSPALILCILLVGCAGPGSDIALSCGPAPAPCTAPETGKAPMLSYERWGAVKPPADEARLMIVMPDGRTLLVP